MIDKKLGEKPVYFEISIGNAGNAIDGHNESKKDMGDSDSDELGKKKQMLLFCFWLCFVFSRSAGFNCFVTWPAAMLHNIYRANNKSELLFLCWRHHDVYYVCK